MTNKSEALSARDSTSQHLKSEVAYQARRQEICNKIFSASSLDEILIDLKDEITSLFDAERITVYVVDGRRRELVSRFKSGMEIAEIRIPVSNASIAGYAANKQKMINIRDVYDHLSKYYEIAETAREQVTNLMEIHLSLISNAMAESSNRTNAIIRRLTLITTIFMPLTLISGIGGMSEFTMMVGSTNWRTAYLILLIVMVIIAAINYVLLLKMENKAEQEYKK
jgi:Mg2+ and Co2+ transporter CorA